MWMYKIKIRTFDMTPKKFLFFCEPSEAVFCRQNTFRHCLAMVTLIENFNE